MFPGTYLSTLVNIGLVTTEIILMWTIVVRTNVAWTNVTVTVGICSRCSQEPGLEVARLIRSSKLGKLKVRLIRLGS